MHLLEIKVFRIIASTGLQQGHVLLIVFYSAETHNFKFDEQLICTLLLIKAIKWKELSRIHIPHYSKRFHNSKASKKKSKAREKINLSAGQLF
jgi:hypothetical protein